MFKVSKIYKILILIMVGLLVTACGAEPTATPDKIELRDDYKEAVYDSFEDGLNNFSHNALIDVHNSLAELANSDYMVDLKGSQKDYYDGICLAFDMLKLEMSVIAEISALKPNADYPDTASGALMVSGGDGYRILQGSNIKFGYESQNRAMSGSLEWGTGYMNWSVNEKIAEKTSVDSKAEIIMTKKHGTVLRYWAHSSVDKKDSLIVLYVIANDTGYNVGYYTGDASPSGLIDLYQFSNYDLRSLSYGVGTVIGFNIEK